MTSFDLVREVRDLRDLKSPAKAILLSLALRANDARQCWPSVKLIALDSGFGASTVKRALTQLSESGLIVRERRTNQDRGDPESTLYTVRGRPTPVQSEPTPSVQCGPSVQSGPTPSVQSGPGVGSERAGGGSRAGHEDPEKIQEDPAEKIQQRARKGTRGSRLSPAWRPDEELIAFARSHGIADVDRAAAEFVDYWIAVSGHRGVKLDWSATFKNRIRMLAERKERGSYRAAPAQRAKQPLVGEQTWMRLPSERRQGDPS